MSRGVILITGAGQRIGRAIATRLADEGWAVAVHYHRSAEAADELVRAITGGGGRAAGFAADLADEDQVAGLVPLVTERMGPVTALINNASVFAYDDALSADRQSWDRHMAVNLRAPFVLTQSVARALPDGQKGAVINLLDQRVWNLTPHFVSYTVSKSALWTLTRTLALALAPRIRVNAIGPGPTLPSARQTEAQFERQWRTLPLRQPVAVTDIAAAASFLLDTDAITGQMIALDSGQHLGWAQAKNRDAPEE